MKTIVFLKTIRTASTNNLCVFRRLFTEGFIGKTYCIAEVDNLSSKTESLYISNHHSPAGRAKKILDALDPSIWEDSIKVTSVRNPWDQAVSCFWRTFVETQFYTFADNNNRTSAFGAAMNAEMEEVFAECVEKAKEIFNEGLEIIEEVLSQDPKPHLLASVVEKSNNPQTNRLYRDLLFSMKRTLDVLLINKEFVADFFIKYETMEEDWGDLLNILKINKENLVKRHRNQPKTPILNDLGNPAPSTWGCFNTLLHESRKVGNILPRGHCYQSWYKNNNQKVIEDLMRQVIGKFNYSYV